MDDRSMFDYEIFALGMLIENGELMDDCYLSPEHFYTDHRHSELIGYMKLAYDKNGELELLGLINTMDEESKKLGNDRSILLEMGGMQYLIGLSGAVPSKINFSNLQDTILSRYASRQAKTEMSAASEAFHASDTLEDAQSIVQGVMDGIESIAEQKGSKGFIKGIELATGHAEVMSDKSENNGKIGIPSVGVEMDKIIHGLKQKEMMITAARPSVGKTALMINESIRSLSEEGVANLVVSAEMSKDAILDRYASAIGNIEASDINRGVLNDDQWSRYINFSSWLQQSHLYIDDTSGITIEEIQRRVKRAQKELNKQGITKIVLFVDYLQLIRSEKKFPTDRERVAYVSTTLKHIARSQNIAVNSLAQLNRELESRADKRPMMSDLGNSGGIERDADVIRFLHREDYYDKNTDKKDIIEINVAKQRNGATGSVEMYFLKEKGKFLDIQKQY